jgi:acyl-CoA thioesterase I
MSTFTALLHRFIVVIILSVIGTAHAHERLVLVFGDSLSSGYHIDVKESWPALLDKRLQESGFNLHVVNASRKGETTDGGRSRLAEVLNEHRPALVILALGANDGLRKKPLTAMKENLNEMLSMVRANGGTPILVGMKLPPDFDAKYAEDFSNVFAQTAAQTHTPFVPFLLQDVVGDPSLFLFDRLHPSAAAQRKLLDAVWPVLSETLSAQ